ncbi:uncharacterized protein LOC135121488 [Zophobas morio]|uniref:uncharacterized protein LOC135121488 n=1 Tax=Zophobas morio TaxID=2755281 RepID=UPI003082F977
MLVEVVILISVVIVILYYAIFHGIEKRSNLVFVAVLGDLGHSPRIIYHALSLVQNNYKVYLLGYDDSCIMKEVLEHPNLSVHYLKKPSTPLHFPKRAFYLLYLPFKTISLLLNLVMSFIILPAPQHILIQNPPAVPLMLVALFFSKLRGAKLIIDWHNFGYTILALKLGKTSFFVKLYKHYEIFLGKFADDNFCVTEEMKKALSACNIKARKLYDRPPAIFKSLSEEEKIQFFKDFNNNYFNAFPSPNKCHSVKFIVSSTSWTEDEDFTILYDALKLYSLARQSQSPHLPAILCIISGKGPMRSHFEALVRRSPLDHVSIHTVWLAIEDYPRFLAAADLGVCLHLSSSGIDLPMKAVDMLGSGIPVCAVSYRCIDELIIHGVNGLIFKDARELSLQLQNLFYCTDNNGSSLLEALRKGALEFQKRRWTDQWNEVALPTFR